MAPSSVLTWMCGLFLWTLAVLVPWCCESVPADLLSASEKAMHSVAQGRLLLQRGAFEQAAIPLQQAVQLYASERQPEGQGVALTLLAQVYQALGQCRQALQHLEDALVVAKQTGNREHIVSILGTLGSIYLTTGPTRTASRYLHQGLDMARANGYRLLTATLLNNLGSLLTLQQQFDKALVLCPA